MTGIGLRGPEGQVFGILIAQGAITRSEEPNEIVWGTGGRIQAYVRLFVLSVKISICRCQEAVI